VLERVGEQFAKADIDFITIQPNDGLAQRAAEGVGPEVGGECAAKDSEGVEPVIKNVLSQTINTDGGAFLQKPLEVLHLVDEHQGVETAQVPARDARLMSAPE